ncbi:hypothetical protein SAMN04488691_103235 [Haloferax larsenii]|uniref:Small CPxCG-related zinc finger protein n=1 Tax=Haloferax larsenii TaxID=302484 RepID=A0A1H7NA55_HALLR|nr:hypothetical protein SAMN04488691_103235 [Haloferax larsenii]
MPIAEKSDTTCPNCSENDDVWVFIKEEGVIDKRCYSCDNCQSEWTEVIKKDS